METSTMIMQETIEAIYNAFAKGDIPFILDHVAENFTWYDPSNPSIVPYGGKHENKNGFLEFFHQLGENTETTVWEVNDYLTGKNKVVAIGKHGFRSKKTGKEAVSDWVMIWQFENGEPISGKSFYNTSVVENAFK